VEENMPVAECYTPTASDYVRAQKCASRDAITDIEGTEREDLQLQPEDVQRLLKLTQEILKFAKIRDEFLETDSETESAFDQLQEIERNERHQIVKEIEQLPLNDSKRISSRLRALIENVEEEYPEEELLSVASMRDFQKFLRSNNRWVYPDIVVSPNGNIVIEWLIDNKRHLTIEFLGQGMSKIVMIAPDITWKNRVSILSAKVSVESVTEAIKPYDALSWVTR
jgi:hypothetical protein